MYSIIERRWFFPVILAFAVLVEILASRAHWRMDTQNNPKLGRLQIGSGYELLLEYPPGKDAAQPILAYNATSEHNHRLTVDIRKARLSDDSLALLAIVNPPKTAGRLIYAPDPEEKPASGPPCATGLKVEFPVEASQRGRSVEIAPPKPEESFDRATTRWIHLVSKFPLAIRVSASSDGAKGPGCSNLLSIGKWQQSIGKDIELTFLADPSSPIDLTLSSPSFHSGTDDGEPMEIEQLHPQRILTRPLGVSRVIQSRDSVKAGSLAITDLRLGTDFFDVKLSGLTGIPLPELLGWTKWPILALVDGPLLVLAIWVASRPRTIFISYSRADRERVMPIYERLKQAGLDVWIDHERLIIGEDWEAQIHKTMVKCRRVIVFLSQAANDGGFLHAELGLARAIANAKSKRAKFILPVRLENCVIPVILSPWNALDLFEPDGERHLFEALGVQGITTSGETRLSEEFSRPYPDGRN